MARAVAEPPVAGRYERKFYIAGIDPRVAELAVRLHPAHFTEIYHQRYVNNCYFDSPDLRFYRDAVQGNSHRVKVRIRWYGDLFGEVPHPVLELKGKKGPLGSKRAVPALPFHHRPQGELVQLEDWLEGGCRAAAITPRLGSLRPALLNRYARRYFLSADGRFRVTIDAACEYFPVASPRDRAGRSAIDDDTVIVELKYAAGDDDDARSVTSAFPFRPTKSSKYVTGVQRLGYR